MYPWSISHIDDVHTGYQQRTNKTPDNRLKVLI